MSDNTEHWSEHLPTSYQSLNEDGCIEIVNNAWLNVFGYDRTDMVNKYFSSILSSSSKEEFTQSFAELKKKSLDCKLFLEVICQNGSLLHIEINGKNEFDSMQQYVRTHCILINVSDKKKAEATIKENEQLFKKLFFESPHGIGITDPQGNIYKANQRFSDLLGYTSAELERLNITQITHHEHIAESNTNIEKLISKQIKSYTQIKRYIKKDGSSVWCNIIASIAKDINGNVQYVVGTIEDITEKRKYEFSRKIIYNISNAIGTTNSLVELIKIIKQELGTLIDTSNFYVALYNSLEDTFSLPYYTDENDVDDPISFPASGSISKYVVKTKQPLLATTAVVKELEKAKKIELIGPPSKIWLGIPLMLDDDIFGVLAVQSYTDENAFSMLDLELLKHISKQISISVSRKKAEEDLNAALIRAKDADRIKSTFLSTMSHELRTPLNAVIGFSGILQEELLDKEAMRYAEIINSSGNHLLELVEGLFDITLIESGGVKCKKEHYSLAHILNNLNQVMVAERTKLGALNIDLSLEYHLPEHFEIYTDALKLKQILINLLKNALKFTHEGSIKFGCYLDKRNTEPILTFFVRDTGIGIPEDKLEYIFHNFNQIDDTHSRQYDGAGIGLSVARQLTELLGGKIWVESKVNNGSQFYFTIHHR